MAIRSSTEIPLHPDLRLAVNIALGLFAFGMFAGWLGLGPTPLGQMLGHLRSPSLPLAVGPFAVFFATIFFCAIDHRATVAAVLAAGIAGGSAHLLINGVPSLAGIKALYFVLVLGLWLGGASLLGLGWLAWCTSR